MNGGHITKLIETDIKDPRVEGEFATARIELNKYICSLRGQKTVLRLKDGLYKYERRESFKVHAGRTGKNTNAVKT